MLYNLLSAFKRIALPPELHDARPKRLRFVLLNGIGKVVRHARETVLRLVGDARRRLADAARLALATGPPLIASACAAPAALLSCPSTPVLRATTPAVRASAAAPPSGPTPSSRRTACARPQPPQVTLPISYPGI